MAAGDRRGDDQQRDQQEAGSSRHGRHNRCFGWLAQVIRMYYVWSAVASWRGFAVGVLDPAAAWAGHSFIDVHKSTPARPVVEKDQLIGHLLFDR